MKLKNAKGKYYKENTVYLYPRKYVNLANKYINTKSLASHMIPKNSINWDHLNENTRKRARNLVNEKNYVIMHKTWPAWLNRNFAHETGHTVKRIPAIKAFIEKTQKEQQTPRVSYTNGKYVKVPTMRNRAARVVQQTRTRNQRLTKIKAALVHAFNYRRAQKRYAGTHLMKYPSENNLGF
jgi:hypothetical protein